MQLVLLPRERVALRVADGVVPGPDLAGVRLVRRRRREAPQAALRVGHGEVEGDAAGPPRAAETTSQTTVKFSLTPAMMQNIFSEEPEVHRIFLENVPHLVSEKNFWQRYFRSKSKHTAALQQNEMVNAAGALQRQVGEHHYL